MNYFRIIALLIPFIVFVPYWYVSGYKELALGSVYGLIVGITAFLKNQ